MARHFGKAITVAAALAFTAGTAAVALARIPTGPALDEAMLDDGADFEEMAMAAPVDAGPLFVADASGAVPACMTDEDVIQQLQADRDQLGGETVMLAGGLEQAFADTWRRQTNADLVEVSTVLAHVLPEGDASFVDVVEIGVDGCALSRTVITGDDWRYLLVQAAGVEA